MNAGYRSKSIFTSALILTVASIITRLLGFVYRIYLSNAIGAEGMGIYQMLMLSYNLAWSVSCSGFTTTISKLVAQENAKMQYGNMGRVLKQSLLIICSIGIVLTCIMFFGADFIGGVIFKEPRIIMPMKILSVAIPFMAAGSGIRGYFLGLRESAVPASSQVLEQCVKMGAIFALGSAFIPYGPEYACAAAVIGILLGEVISFLYVLYSYRSFKIKHSFNAKPTETAAKVTALIFTMALPLTLNRISGSLLSTVENVLIPQRLQLFGLTAKEAMGEYGRITGMAMPLIFFPSAILTSLSISLVSAISEAAAIKNNSRITDTISKSLLFTSIIALFACALFMVFPKELGEMIYRQDISSILFMMGVMCPFWYLGITLNGILNGLGQQTFIFRNSLLSSAINIFFIYIFVPQYGVNAFIFGWFISLLLTTALDIAKIKACVKVKVPIVRWFAKPALAALATGLTINYVSRRYMYVLFGNLWGLVISIALLAVLYIFFICAFGCISISDIKRIFKRGRDVPTAVYSE